MKVAPQTCSTQEGKHNRLLHLEEVPREHILIALTAEVNRK
jgi:hypothetical protein